jgi:hypothetical protein
MLISWTIFYDPASKTEIFEKAPKNTTAYVSAVNRNINLRYKKRAKNKKGKKAREEKKCIWRDTT